MKSKEPLDLFKVLFDEQETTCLAEDFFADALPSNAVHRALHPKYAFYSINPLHSKRLDKNVTAHRNILVEIDKLPLVQQMPYIESLGMPWSTAVFSGKKSLHFVISLADSLPSRAEYDALVKRIYKVVVHADPPNKNPSRFSRYPGHIRNETGKVQSIVSVKDRVPNWLVEEWLEEHGSVQAEEGEDLVQEYKRSDRPVVFHGISMLNGFTKNFLMFGAAQGERNDSLFRAACNCRDAGFSVDEAKSLLHPTLSFLGSDFTELEFMATVSSAYRRVA